MISDGIIMHKRKGISYRICQQLEVVNQGRVPATDVLAKSILHTESGISSAQVNTTPLCRQMKDNQGNHFGLFKLGTLKPKEQRILQLNIAIEPFIVNATKDDLGSLSEIDRSLQKKYCGAKKYWDVNAAEIQKIVTSFAVGIESIRDILAQIFRFLDKLIFRENLTERRGALNVLHSKYGDCDEFTDLFVTMARQAGIPARRITGLFLRPDGPVHHAWAEAFSSKLDWLPFDPALGYFAASSRNHIPRKLEAMVSAISDYEVRFKSKRPTIISINPLTSVPTVEQL